VFKALLLDPLQMVISRMPPSPVSTK
jgi:hypothetical protein